MYKMGSAHIGLKIDKPVEKDFTYEINTQTIFGKNAMLTDLKSESNLMVIHVDFGGESPDLSKFDFVQFPSDNPELERILPLNGSKDVR